METFNAFKHRKFSDSKVERVYLHHIISDKRSDNFHCFLFAMALSVLLQVANHFLWWTETTLHQGPLRHLGLHGNRDKIHDEVQNSIFVAIVMGTCGLGVLAIVVTLQNKRIMNSPICPPVTVLLWTTIIIVPIAVRTDSVPLRLGLGWIMLESFLIWVTLPVNFNTAIFYSVSVGGTHTAVVAWKGKNQALFVNQLVANIIMLGASNAIGIIAFYFNDKRQRAAFLDTKKSLEVKEAMEEATQEQMRLLFSVLPKHLAEKMAKDTTESSSDGAFKKIYMNRHEPVSILFADIVGFTAMSAAIGSASMLVEILNDLFSTFDSLSEKFQQTRIKILGDCYYCICGAPEENPDHAILSVYMGLAVVEAIKLFQKRTNSDVDMRVGIHTGAVLAGVLGQRQWQYDVYSEDVIIANKLESSGVAGKVHITDRTFSFLNGRFEVMPGDGDLREDKLKQAGIKTFFITKVLIPFQEEVTDKKLNARKQSHAGDTYGERLEAHLERQHENSGAQFSKLTLSFKDKDKEEAFIAEADPSSGHSFFGLVLTIASTSTASIFVISFNMIGFAVSSAVIIAVSLTGLWIITKRTEVTEKRVTRSIMTALCALAIAAANFTFLIPCFEAGSIRSQNKTALKNREAVSKEWDKLNCYYPAYFPLFIPLGLFSLTIMSNTASFVKITVSLLIMLGSILVINVGPLKDAFRFSEIFSFVTGFDLVLESFHVGVYMIMVLVILGILCRQLEISTRSLFLQKYDVQQLEMQAIALSKRNEALMCNIMPHHVAEHFLDKSINHDKLYSHNYTEVGILFASMPNFSEFYTEDAITKGGLECLRFLNEVISDYDALLDDPKFNDKIIKIKTIGSTYMAASGLNPHIQANPGDTTRERWRHLKTLVEFVFEMRSTLDRINKESYNQFALKIGINHGPVTAGVIGKTMPAYDTWGNTVNVSSRMESTGKVGTIQVTESCYKILRIFGYKFEQRGYVFVKGKGDLLTYFLVDKGNGELTDEEVDALDAETVSLPKPEL